MRSRDISDFLTKGASLSSRSGETRVRCHYNPPRLEPALAPPFFQLGTPLCRTRSVAIAFSFFPVGALSECDDDGEHYGDCCAADHLGEVVPLCPLASHGTRLRSHGASA
jgi:hypothetical protein